jgi:hypothetical protein
MAGRPGPPLPHPQRSAGGARPARLRRLQQPRAEAGTLRQLRQRRACGVGGFQTQIEERTPENHLGLE